jgi:cysteine-rich repeat protein
MRVELLSLLAVAAVAAGAPAARAACVADCDGDGRVVLSEAVEAIVVALGQGATTDCPAADLDGDGSVSIAEILLAVGDLLRPDSSCCGDGQAQPLEECDDGNTFDGDGCSATCQLEPGGDPCAGSSSQAGTALAAELLVDRLDRPVHVATPPLDPNRLFIVEQPGRIMILENGEMRDEPFLDISHQVGCCGERGLFSIAFHPDYAENGRFFVDYTSLQGHTVIARYERGADEVRADPASGRTLLTIEQPFSNHNGGQLAFGPDGFLYVGMGDGGSRGDPNENAQNDDSLLGKLLRLDVDVDEPPYYRVPPGNPRAQRGDRLGLIWAKGLRNPWRFSFDRASGDLYIADVGQDRFEEVDVQPAASRGGENYGWDIFEARSCYEPDPFETCPSPPDGFVFPVVDYPHPDGCSITGGFVYRGCALPELHGTYFYGDYCTGFVRSFVLHGGVATEERDWTDELTPSVGVKINRISSFGEDSRGELYVVDFNGRVFKLVPAPQ